MLLISQPEHPKVFTANFHEWGGAKLFNSSTLHTDFKSRHTRNTLLHTKQINKDPLAAEGITFSIL